VTVRREGTDLLRRAFVRIPPAQRLAILHGLGRYAPWEAKFDFTPPLPAPGEETGPPDFVGIGVQKAGTTWWYQLLSEHPGVSTRADLHKERHFFDRFGTRPFGSSDVEDYQGWFPRRRGSLAGEWTPDYFTLPWVPPLLREAAPEARLLLILRDPVERFRSGLAHQQSVGVSRDGATIADAVERGFYDRALTRWLEHFELEQLLVLQHERCITDFEAQLATTFAFLGLEPPGADVGSPPRSRTIAPHPALPDDVRRRLVDLYAPDVVALATRLPDVDLASWPNFAHLAE